SRVPPRPPRDRDASPARTLPAPARADPPRVPRDPARGPPGARRPEPDRYEPLPLPRTAAAAGAARRRLGRPARAAEELVSLRRARLGAHPLRGGPRLRSGRRRARADGRQGDTPLSRDRSRAREPVSVGVAPALRAHVGLLLASRGERRLPGP